MRILADAGVVALTTSNRRSAVSSTGCHSFLRLFGRFTIALSSESPLKISPTLPFTILSAQSSSCVPGTFRKVESTHGPHQVTRCRFPVRVIFPANVKNCIRLSEKFLSFRKTKSNFCFILFYRINYDPFRSISIITFVHN